MTTTPSKSVVFITGAFLSSSCWDEWVVLFEQNGYQCAVPDWPYKNAEAEDLRNRHPDTDIALNTLPFLTEYFAAFIKTLPEKPVLIGHSLGGLIVQLLLQQDLGAAGVAVHSFPPKGVRSLRFTFIKAAWKAMGLFSSLDTTYLISFRRWKKTIANGMHCDDQKKYYYQYAIPESKRIIRDLFKRNTKVNFKAKHVPLLFTAGGRDQIVSSQLIQNNYQKYKMNRSITAYKNFQEHNHLVFGQPAWKDEADFILNWIKDIHYYFNLSTNTYGN